MGAVRDAAGQLRASSQQRSEKCADHSGCTLGGGGHPGTPTPRGKEPAKKPEEEHPAGQQQVLWQRLLTTVWGRNRPLCHWRDCASQPLLQPVTGQLLAMSTAHLPSLGGEWRQPSQQTGRALVPGREEPTAARGPSRGKSPLG